MVTTPARRYKNTIIYIICPYKQIMPHYQHFEENFVVGSCYYNYLFIRAYNYLNGLARAEQITEIFMCFRKLSIAFNHFLTY
jgi:hypothetical protein